MLSHAISLELTYWKTDSHSPSQESTHVLWNWKIHYCTHNSLSLVPILSHMHPVHNFSPYFPKIQSIKLTKIVTHFV